ncbi:MAG: MaoC family dehydratase [Hyphomicrobiaceae bacterium]|nr:MaoC family dehydratase [Hyphomicrobiaceae bacterium]
MAAEHLNDELHGYYLEDLKVGMTAAYAKTVTETDIVLFAGISGDINPVHLNHEFAATTAFAEPIAHGMLTASFISTVLGTKLPGPGCIYLKQSLAFRAPVKARDTVLARCTVSAIDEARQTVTLDCKCFVGEKVVLTGEALMKVSRRPA